jgi:hypothetical protein
MPLYVEPIDAKQTYDMLLNVHYAKRIPSITYAFGLFDSEAKALIGCCTFGTPPSAPLRKGVCGPDFSDRVLELNRLCLIFNRKNEASFTVARSIKMLPKPKIIMSFADTEQDHLGIVYQATNFIYTGLSAKRTDWKVKGREHLHGQTIADEFRGVKNRAQAMRDKYGDDFFLQPRPRKHRYVFFTGTKRDKAEMLSALRYPVLPYPKMNQDEQSK